MRNKTLKVFEKLNISEHKLLKFADLKESVIFKKYYDYYEEDFIKKDFTFRNILSDLIEELNLSNQEEKEEKKPDYCIDKEIAFNYFLCEMPILLNTPSLLGYSSSCIVYHQINSLHTYLYVTKNLQGLGQGFIAVNFE